MGRFVLLRHELPPGGERPSHWDFMLERDGSLATWAIDELPAMWARQLGVTVADSDDVAATVRAMRLPDHRLAYLDYEGQVSRGRGAVVRVATGEFSLLQESEQELIVALTGPPLAGVVRIRHSGDDVWGLHVQ